MRSEKRKKNIYGGPYLKNISGCGVLKEFNIIEEVVF